MQACGAQSGSSVGVERRGSQRARPESAVRRTRALLLQSAFLAAILAVPTFPAAAQMRSMGPPSALPSDSDSGLALPSAGGRGVSTIPTASAPTYDAAMSSSEACTTWTEAGFHSPTVSAARLMVPGKASSEYQHACGALKGHKLDEAEAHIRKALDVYPKYAAAWVVLGQILEGQEKRADARRACSQAMSIDASYIPPYICLADFAAREGDWDQVSVLADRAQRLDPVSNAFVFYFTAGVQFHFRQLHQAEANAEAAIKLDAWHRMPELHYLMAEIFQAEGDLRKQAAQLREYLKNAPNAANAAQAKTLLAQIEPKLSAGK